MRPIDADDVIERLDMICDAGGYLSPVTKAVRSFCKGLINNQPTIESEPVNGWISVKDRLPEIKEHYRSELVICYSPDGEYECLFDYYEMNGFGQGCFTAEKYFGITITHWRTLPKPPKGE